MYEIIFINAEKSLMVNYFLIQTSLSIPDNLSDVYENVYTLIRRYYCEIHLHELNVRKIPRAGTFIFISSRPLLNIQGHNDIKNSGPCSK